MNKKMKGWLAAGLGGALLLGGGGTFAMWSLDGDLVSPPIEIGSMSIDIDGDEFTWEWAGGAAQRLVPGSPVTGTVPVPVTIDGDLTAELSVNEITFEVTGGTGAELPEEAVIITSQVGDSEGPAVVTESGTVPLTVTVELQDVVRDQGMGASIDLGDITVTLTQVTSAG